MIKQLHYFLLLFTVSTFALNAQAQDYSLLKITEIHYHPLDSIYEGNDTVGSKSFEFIEFKNISFSQSLDVSGVIVDSAINFEFPENTVLAPQEYYVAAAKPSKFYDRYKKEAQGNYSSSLSNGGEQIMLFAPDGSTIMDFTYYDADPWPEAADGDGPSLVSAEINPTGDPQDYLYWKSSRYSHGSPGYTDPISTSVENEQVSHENSFVLYPNPTSGQLTIRLNDELIGNVGLELIAVNGAIVYSNTLQKAKTIDLNELSIEQGIYFLKIISNNNVQSQKVIYTPF